MASGERYYKSLNCTEHMIYGTLPVSMHISYGCQSTSNLLFFFAGSSTNTIQSLAKIHNMMECIINMNADE